MIFKIYLEISYLSESFQSMIGVTVSQITQAHTIDLSTGVLWGRISALESLEYALVLVVSRAGPSLKFTDSVIVLVSLNTGMTTGSELLNTIPT